ncbi:hypothetical protein SDC9_158342 [bioreactor metagenome]|uniref:Uncharacterized protein n=1 Tax=bioreactor metagenome TaxID=1076179 RepID=A0A645F9R7_9ZZZZ
MVEENRHTNTQPRIHKTEPEEGVFDIQHQHNLIQRNHDRAKRNQHRKDEQRKQEFRKLCLGSAELPACKRGEENDQTHAARSEKNGVAKAAKIVHLVKASYIVHPGDLFGQRKNVGQNFSVRLKRIDQSQQQRSQREQRAEN